jgi:hypothetical protein
MRQIPHKRPMRRISSKIDQVQMAVRDQDRSHLEALARILDANDATAQRLRAEIEQILAEGTCSGQEALPSRAASRH